MYVYMCACRSVYFLYMNVCMYESICACMYIYIYVYEGRPMYVHMLCLAVCIFVYTRNKLVKCAWVY